MTVLCKKKKFFKNSHFISLHGKKLVSKLEHFSEWLNFFFFFLIINTSTRWHNELNRTQIIIFFKQKTFTFGYDNYMIIIIMGGR